MDYERVIEDFASGKLDKNKVTLVMDNDGGYWNVKDDDDCEQSELLNAEYGTPNGYNDIVSVLNAAGVPCEWC